MANRLQSYEIEEVGTIGAGVLAVKLFDPLTNDRREAALCINRDRVTNELTVGVYRHYRDPDSEPWFKDTEPWPEDESRGQDG